MKKILIAAVCVAVVLVAIIVFTGKNKPEEEPSTTVSETAQTEVTTEDKTPEIQNGTKNPDKLVKITMPLSYFDAENQTDIGGFFKKSSYKSCKVNEKNNTFTITIKSINHDFMLSNVGLQVVKTLATLLDSDDYPYIKELGRYNSDFSEIELIVDEKQYKQEKDPEILLAFVGSSGIYYQLYTTENEYQCKVAIKGAKSGKILAEKTFNQDNKGNIS